jgi:hypothetical protein
VRWRWTYLSPRVNCFCGNEACRVPAKTVHPRWQIYQSLPNVSCKILFLAYLLLFITFLYMYANLILFPYAEILTLTQTFFKWRHSLEYVHYISAQGYKTEHGNQSQISSIWLDEMATSHHFSQSDAWDLRLVSNLSFITFSPDTWRRDVTQVVLERYLFPREKIRFSFTGEILIRYARIRTQNFTAWFHSFKDNYHEKVCRQYVTKDYPPWWRKNRVNVLCFILAARQSIDARQYMHHVVRCVPSLAEVIALFAKVLV